jgi:hypothetical protein
MVSFGKWAGGGVRNPHPTLITLGGSYDTQIMNAQINVAINRYYKSWYEVLK